MFVTPRRASVDLVVLPRFPSLSPIPFVNPYAMSPDINIVPESPCGDTKLSFPLSSTQRRVGSEVRRSLAMIDTPSGFRVTRGQENYAGANNLPISQLLSSNDVRSKITFRKPMKRPVNQKDEDDGDSAPVKLKRLGVTPHPGNRFRSCKPTDCAKLGPGKNESGASNGRKSNTEQNHASGILSFRKKMEEWSKKVSRQKRDQYSSTSLSSVEEYSPEDTLYGVPSKMPNVEFKDGKMIRVRKC